MKGTSERPEQQHAYERPLCLGYVVMVEVVGVRLMCVGGGREKCETMECGMRITALYVWH